MDEPQPTGESIYRAVAGFALLIGAGALLFPRTLLRIYGVDASELSGAGILGWRLFAIRNLAVAGAAFSGHSQARDVVFAVQFPDFAIFAHSYRTRAIPRRTSVLAMISAGSIALLSAVARSRS